MEKELSWTVDGNTEDRDDVGRVPESERVSAMEGGNVARAMAAASAGEAEGTRVACEEAELKVRGNKGDGASSGG